MDPLMKKVVFVLLMPIILIWIIIAIPHLYPETEPDPYPWFTLGTDTIIDLLWDSEATKFQEMPVNATGFWVDDQAKLLWLMLENPEKYQSYIEKTIDNLYSVWHQGYFPRRWVKIEPELISNDTENADIANGFLRIMGDLTGANASNPLRVRYYEAAGYCEMFYLGGQLFMVERIDKNYHMITYDPMHLRAEQCQNPSFDVWNPDWDNETMLLPWTFSYPSDWYYSHEPPLGCAYSTRWVFEKDNTGRCVGLERYVTGATKNWRCVEFSVSNGTAYTWSFKYRGQYNGGGTFKAYIRWFDSDHAFISQNFTEFSSNYDSWQTFSQAYTSPDNAFFADIMFWSESDTDGDYYFDDVSLNGCTILNADLEDVNNLPFSTTEYHSRSKEIGRSLKLYNSYDYIRQWLPVTVNVSRFYNFTFWGKSAIPTTNVKWYVFYDDGTYTEVSRAIDSSDWDLYGVQASELSANKIIVAFALKTQSPNIDTFVDDVAVNYKPVNAGKSESVNAGPEDYLGLPYVETVQNYEDDDVNLTIRFRLNRDKNHIEQRMTFDNKQSYDTYAQFISALDGLSTVTSGEGSQETAYSSVWIPEIGRRSHQQGAYITTLLDSSEAYKWSSKHDYFIVELKQIPEWAGSYGIAIKVPVDKFYVLQNSNSNASSPYLHYLTYSFRFEVKASKSETFIPKMLCLNGYDFTDPGVYDHYFMNLENYETVDLSMCYHIGTILHALARHLQVRNLDPLGMGLKTWDYYRNVFSSHNNGSYLLTTGKVMEASMIYYNKLGNSKYLNFAKNLADYLVDLQITDAGIRQGTFPMKHNNVTYLDCHSACLIGLKLVRGYNSAYLNAYNLGMNAIKYNYKPDGFNKIFDPEDYGTTVPNIKRLFVYSNNTHIDDDFFTFKSAYATRASLTVNQSLTMLALSRVWRNVAINETSLVVYVCESIPDRELPGTRSDWISTNSETQPYGLVAWLQVARHQRKTYEYYYEFLMNHYAIEQGSISKSSLHVNITGQEGKGSVSSFYLKGEKEYAIPLSIKVNEASVSEIHNLEALYAHGSNCYYYDPDNYILVVKGFIVNGLAELKIAWKIQLPEPWMPIMPILGFLGIFLMMISPVYCVNELKKGKFQNIAIAFLLFIVGFALLVGWIWG